MLTHALDLKDPDVILSIDPSVNKLGWAVYHTGGTSNDLYGRYVDSDGTTKRCWDYGLFEPDSTRLVTSICRYFLDALQVRHYRITKVVVETPTFFNSPIGRIAAKQGYTQKLSWINGFIAGYYHLEDGSYFEYPPREWKGTMSKEMTRSKMMRDFELDPHDRALELSNDTIDAIMILKYYLDEQKAIKKAFK
jgi:hypothetical protein